MHPDRSGQPLVSILLRTRDRRETLAFALASCVAQDYRPLDLVVVNDGGVDVSDLLPSAVSGVRVRHIRHSESLGRCQAGNAALDAAAGGYLIFLDDDDWFAPQHVSGLVEALGAQPDCLAAYAGVSYREAPDAPELHCFNEAYDPVAQRLENHLPIHSVLFSRRLLELGCRLDTSLDVFEDWDFWLQCARFTSFVHLDRVSAGYRAGGGSNAGWGQSAERVAQARQRLLGKWKNLWSAEELDEALRWAQERLGRAMESHRDLHEEHQRLEAAHADLCDVHRLLCESHEQREAAFGTVAAAHAELESQHGDLIQAHRALEALHADLSQTHRLLRAEQGSLQEELKRLHYLYTESDQAYRATLLSTSWRVTWPLRAVSLTAQRLRAGAGPWLTMMPRFASTVFEARRVTGGWWPLARKLGLRLRQDGLGGSVRRLRFHVGRRGTGGGPTSTLMRHAPPFCPSDAQLARIPPYRCGLMVHIFFADLIPELFRYLAKMPVPYQLLVSVPTQRDQERVLAQRSTLGPNATLSVKVLPNRGRDIAPLLVGFRDEIAELDIVGHIHTKKSSYTGSALFGERWRRYLLDAMLGDGDRVRAAFAQFAADPDVGIIYPETFPDLPYWAHTWLSNRGHARNLLSAMGYGDIDYGQYIDFPAGSMFWARTQALKPLFDLRLSMADFPAESGQTDNTLHHAIERCLVFSAQAAGLTRRIQSVSGGRSCFYGRSRWVFDQYGPSGLAERLRLACAGSSLVSFDLFDTLLLRPFARPEALLWMLEERIEREFGLAGFAAKRHQAESMVRALAAPGTDVRIEEIYRGLAEAHQLPADLAERLLRLEVETEQRLLTVNPVVAATVRELRGAGRRLILVSDMYLGEVHLRPVLRRLGLDVFDRLSVSADTGRRKDRGDVWDDLLEQEGIAQDRLLHVGDNEHSDVQVLVDRGFPHPLHVMRPAALLGVMPGGADLIATFRQRPSWRNELMLGLVANRVSQHLGTASGSSDPPFADPRVFGYGVIGPIVFVFMTWLLRSLRRDRSTSVRFLSREGWLLNRLYQWMRAHPAVVETMPSLPEGRYFYCSRSVFLLAAIEQESDLEMALGAHYDGSLRQLLTARLGLTDLTAVTAILGEEILGQVFRLPDDHFQLMAYLRRCLPELVREAARQRELIREYWSDSGAIADALPGIVDVGYSGTIQLGLMRVIGHAVKGYYVVTNASAGRVLERGGDCAACFGHLLPLERMDAEPLHRYALVLESVLTSPEGQLAGFCRVAGRLQPQFKPSGASQRHFATIEKIHDGVLDYCADMLAVLGSDFAEGDWDLAAISGLLPLVVGRNLDIGDLANALWVEDQYCGNQELSVLDFYDRQATEAGLG